MKFKEAHKFHTDIRVSDKGLFGINDGHFILQEC